MIARVPLAGFGLALAAVVLGACLAPAQDMPVYDKLTVQDLEKVLTTLQIRFDKQAHPKTKDQSVLAFDLKKHPVVLAFTTNGKGLTLQATFSTAALEKINDWNLRGNFSRAHLGAAGTAKDRAVLERTLDVEGPVAGKALERFLRGFEEDVDSFQRFLGETAVVAPRDEIKPLPPGVVRELTELELRMQALSEKIIPDDNTMVMTFPVGDDEWKTAWKVTWDISTIQNERSKTNHFFRIDKAWFKTSPKEPWLQVLGDARVSELFAAYSDGMTRFHDMRDFEFPLLKLSPKDVGNRGRVIGKDKKVGAEIRERGILWGRNSDANKTSMKSRRGQELVLWATLHAANYYYIIQYGFQDDGMITFRAGATGFNLPKRTNVAHVHNTCWRVNVNLGGTGKNSVYVVSHEELPKDAGKATQTETLITVESPGEWHAKEFTHLRIKHQLEQKGAKPREIAYDLLPLRAGSARHYGKNEEFAHHDYWVTPTAAEEIFYYKLPTYIKKQNPRPVVNTDVTLWYMSSVLHAPRSEDGHMENGQVMTRAGGVALTAWSGFDLRPRNVFPTTPLYP